MAPDKNLDVDPMMGLIAALLHDVFARIPLKPVFSSNDEKRALAQAVETNYACLRKTIQFVERRVKAEGVSFLTKTLPSLGKHLDEVLSHEVTFNCMSVRFKPYNHVVAKDLNPERDPGSWFDRRPLFLWHLFANVMDQAGVVYPSPCAESVKLIRQVCYLFYKYELPYTAEQEHAVVEQFKETEDDLCEYVVTCEEIRQELSMLSPATVRFKSYDLLHVAREARILLSRLFAGFDILDITPRHGPGAVATKQQLWEKYQWTNVSSRLTILWPFEEYFCSSLGHLVDEYPGLYNLGDKDLPARVVLVPKDSRGPRLISCEPVDKQWIQQGLMREIVRHVEAHPLTKGIVNFTTQEPNRIRALAGSVTGEFVTLDLAEASDRVTLELVRLLFPSHVCEALEASRSSATVLPDGSQLELKKFAPMGSGLCFPILALTIWALVTSAAPDRKSSMDLLVYGDDVIVPRGNTRDTMEVLEAFGLKINRSKSCTNGFFRESCGMDAFLGVNVTPVRIRTVWSSSRSPEAYTSWVAYANLMWDKRYYKAYWYISDLLFALYGTIPETGMTTSSCPSLPLVPEEWRPRKFRINPFLQKKEYLVWDLKTSSCHHELRGWHKLLRYFTETQQHAPTWLVGKSLRAAKDLSCPVERSVSSYTHQRRSKLVRRWR